LAGNRSQRIGHAAGRKYFAPKILHIVAFLRRAFGNMRSEEATESILQRMKRVPKPNF
jgi:hypothetical protein